MGKERDRERKKARECGYVRKMGEKERKSK